jgi:hypothetical protein
MKLVANWRVVLRHAWSIRLMLVAALFSGLDAAQPLVAGLVPIPPIFFAVFAALISAAAFIARLVAQEQFTSPDRGQTP